MQPLLNIFTQHSLIIVTQVPVRPKSEPPLEYLGAMLISSNYSLFSTSYGACTTTGGSPRYYCPISGGIFGPLAGVVTGASIPGFDYTGRDFGYGFARPVARQNYALASYSEPKRRTADFRRLRPNLHARSVSRQNRRNRLMI